MTSEYNEKDTSIQHNLKPVETSQACLADLQNYVPPQMTLYSTKDTIQGGFNDMDESNDGVLS